MDPIISLPASLRSAFDRGHEQICFGIRERVYLFVSEYDEWPSLRECFFVSDSYGALRLTVFMARGLLSSSRTSISQISPSAA